MYTFLFSADVLEMFSEKWPAEYGEIYRIFLDKHCFIGISSPELLEVYDAIIFRSIFHYIKRKVHIGVLLQLISSIYTWVL